MSRKSGFMQEFKKFILRGNVMDMAVGVIVGGAFYHSSHQFPDHRICDLLPGKIHQQAGRHPAPQRGDSGSTYHEEMPIL